MFSEVIAYLMTGSCTIKASTVVALACAAEYYELEDLRQACQERFPDCLHVDTVCRVLSEIEVYYDYHTAKNMLVKVRVRVSICVCLCVWAGGCDINNKNVIRLTILRLPSPPLSFPSDSALRGGACGFGSLQSPLPSPLRAHGPSCH